MDTNGNRAVTGKSRRYPEHDGWFWLYRLYDRYVAPRRHLRAVVIAYFTPNRLERMGAGQIYRVLGVHWFGKVIPTGGILVRRMTRLRMKAYTLAGTSLGSAVKFRYKTCVFEFLHLPFLAAMFGLSLHRWMIGRPDLALENMLVNLVANVYPILHHRYTRLRIDLLQQHTQRRPSSQLLQEKWSRTDLKGNQGV